MEKISNQFDELKKITLLGVKKVLTTEDLSLLTGISRSYIYKMVSKKKIPYYKSQGGKFIYFERSEIEKWLLTNRVATDSELNEQVENYSITGKWEGGQNEKD